MVHLRLTKKTIRRLCVTMALIAPIIYLFGTMFTYLNGAHGDILLAQEENPTSIIYDSVVYTGYDVDSDGELVSGLYVCTSAPFDVSYENALYRVTFNIATNSYTKNVHYYDADMNYLSASPMVYNGLPYYDFQGLAGASFARFTLSNYGGNFGIQISVSGTDLLPVISDIENSNYLFGQMFPHDNFLSKIGADAVSDSPHGFAPFGTLFRYIDDNMLHLADTQEGLMAYGYMYWCAHVLLFDVVFMLMTFFVTMISHITDKIGGTE